MSPTPSQSTTPSAASYQPYKLPSNASDVEPQDDGLNYSDNESGKDASEDEAEGDSENDQDADGGDDQSDSGSDHTQSSTDLYGQEHFDTFQHKASQLARELGIGEPSQVERMGGGSFNRVIGLKFLGPDRDYILRIPREPYAGNEDVAIKDQVSILAYLSKYEFLKTPTVLSYDTTANNALGSPYVLQSRLSGECLSDSYYELPLDEKLQITTLVAELAIKLDSISLEKPGRLMAGSTLPDSTQRVTPLSLPEGVKITAFRESPGIDHSLVEKKPINDLLFEMLENTKQRDLASSDVYTQKMAEKYERLQEILLEMEEVNLMRPYDSECLLWHWDLFPRNIMVTKTEILESTCNVSESSPHKAHFSIDDGVDGHKHSIDVKVKCEAGKSCNHNVKVWVADQAGRTYRHELTISGSETSKLPFKDETNEKESVNLQTPRPQWSISGVLDWDDVLSVPIVMARRPHKWLWFDHSDRGDEWLCDHDEPLPRELDVDELRIKAHYDQIMTAAIPSYEDDAYGRGVWLRRLAKFVFDGFSDKRDWDRYDVFVRVWEEEYERLKGKVDWSGEGLSES